MKNRLWIGGLVLALFVRGADLLAEDGQWRAVDDSPSAETPGVTLDRPVPLPSSAVNEAPPAPLPGGLVPVNYEVPVISSPPMEPAPEPSPSAPPPPSQPEPEIIAVSAPLSPPLSSAVEDEEESSETIFAIDRPLRPLRPMRRPQGPIVQTSASVPVMSPMADTTVPPVAALPDPGPGWNANWSAAPAGQSSFGGDFADQGGSANLPSRRFYLRGEYLLWFLKGDPLPVLATTSVPADFGVLGAPSTNVLFGGNSNISGPFSGGRFFAGYWLDTCQPIALEFGGFFLGPRSNNFVTNSFANPVIGRPFLEANNGQETAQLTSLPGVAAGQLAITAPTSLWGLEANALTPICCGCNYRLNALAGFRNINLDENITITESIQGLSTAPPPFTNEMITVQDRFATQNHFYGGQIGVQGRWYQGRWSVEGFTKLAIGGNQQSLDISGYQRFVAPNGTVQNFNGGLLALPSNIGNYTHDAFSFIPEVGVNLGYQILPGVRGFVGYNFLYWTNVIRPGTSIDRNLDVTQIPNFPLNPEPAPVPGQHPAPVFHETNFWAQGITFGVEFNY